jgi:hypothetical protein
MFKVAMAAFSAPVREPRLFEVANQFSDLARHL